MIYLPSKFEVNYVSRWCSFYVCAVSTRTVSPFPYSWSIHNSLAFRRFMCASMMHIETSIYMAHGHTPFLSLSLYLLPSYGHFSFSSFETCLIMYVSLPVHKIHLARFWWNVFIRLLPAPCRIELFENLAVPQLINKFPSFYRLRIFITVSSTADHWIVIPANFNNILKSTRTYHKGSLSFEFLVNWKTQHR
jgi:hypothetical protein